MKQMWLWLGAIALGVGLLGLIFGSIFDLTGNTISQNPYCVTDSLWNDGNGHAFECNLGERCVAGLGKCVSAGTWHCLDETHRIFVPQAGTPADFQTETCYSNHKCMWDVKEAKCIHKQIIEAYPTKYTLDK